jgi:multidrug transporter EmrE-like cation transporter
MGADRVGAVQGGIFISERDSAYVSTLTQMRIKAAITSARSVLKAAPKLAYLAMVIAKERYFVLASNNITARKLLEDHYTQLFKEDDGRVFDDIYFKDLSLQLDKQRDRLSKSIWWFSIALALLCMSLFKVLDKIAFYGTEIDIRYFTPLILLVYSFSKLSFVLKRVPISISEAILTGYARVKTSDKNVNLYLSRYGVAFALDKDALIAIAPKLSFSGVRQKFARSLLKHIMFVLLAAPLYCLLYLAFIIDALSFSSMGWPLKLSFVTAAALAEIAAISFTLWGHYAAVKDPDATKNFWIKMQQKLDGLIAMGRATKAEIPSVAREAQTASASSTRRTERSG